MSRLSFKSFCIEFYARHIGSTGADVYRMFSESATLVREIVAFLAVHYHVSEGDAMEMFYRSKTAEAFADDSLGLYGQSALRIAADVIQEREGR